MKKIYTVYCTVKLDDSHEWLEAFRAKYDRQHPFHITMKQPAYIDDKDLPKIKSRLEEILYELPSSVPKIRLTFNNLQIDEHDADDGMAWIYVFAGERNKLLDDLQKHIRDELGAYSSYQFKNSSIYERDFNPHLTIGGHLNSQMLEEARIDLPKTISLNGEVDKLILSCVNEPTLEEANNPNNLTVYSLV